jgi:hypothetical protein
MSIFLPVVWSGLLAAAVMALFLVAIEKLGWAKSDMFWTLGKIFSNEKKKAKTIGLFIHATAGVVFAVAYVLLWSVYSPLNYDTFISAGILTGALHGAMVGVSLIIMLTGRNKGWNVAMTQLAAHTLFGLTLGAIVGLLEVKYESVSTIASVVTRQDSTF